MIVGVIQGVSWNAYARTKYANIHASHRPKEFVKKSTYVEDSDEEESTVGKLPPVDSDED